jgi:hypothetical protein
MKLWSVIIDPAAIVLPLGITIVPLKPPTLGIASGTFNENGDVTG